MLHAGKQPPFVGKMLSIERLGGRDRERDVSHIVIDTGGVPFVEGQSFGVVPPVRAEFSLGGRNPGAWGTERTCMPLCILLQAQDAACRRPVSVLVACN